MKRFFGSNKKEPPPSLQDAAGKVDARVEGLDAKIGKLEKELVGYREQIKRTRPGPAQNAIKQRAMRVLKQKKMYEKQRDQLMGQSFNMQQTAFMTQTMEDTVTTVAAMKSAKKTMQGQMKKIDLYEVEDLYDDLAEMMEDNDEIQEALSRCYATPDDLDEADLDAELDALGDEMFDEEEALEMPSYLTTASSVPTGEPSYDIPAVEENAVAAQPAQIT